MSTDSNKSIHLLPGPAKDKSGLAQPSNTDQRAWPIAEDWLRHYEWEGTDWHGFVWPVRQPPPAAPRSGQAISAEQLY